MKTYSEATPTITLLNGGTDIDVCTSQYTNIRFGVSVDSVVTISAQYEANLPGLAYDYYGNQEYWRAILAFNGLVDPINDVQVGVVIGLPSKSSLEAFLASNQVSAQLPVLTV